MESPQRPDAGTVAVTHPALLIRVRKLFRSNMSAQELYEVTRGVWRVGERREGVQYALAVYEGIVREVYSVESWHPANTTPYEFRRDELSTRDLSGRYEFQGRIAPEPIRSLYKGRSVSAHFQRGQANPVTYVNC